MHSVPKSDVKPEETLAALAEAPAKIATDRTQQPLSWNETTDQGVPDTAKERVPEREAVSEEFVMERPPMTIGLLKPRTVSEEEPDTGVVPPEEWTTPKPLEKYHSLDEPYGESIVDAIDAGQYDPDTGLFTDPSNSLNVNLQEAIDYGLFDPRLKEVLNPETKERMSLAQAIELGLVDPVKGVFNHPGTREELTLDKARKLRYISKDLKSKMEEWPIAMQERFTLQPEAEKEPAAIGQPAAPITVQETLEAEMDAAVKAPEVKTAAIDEPPAEKTAEDLFEEQFESVMEATEGTDEEEDEEKLFGDAKEKKPIVMGQRSAERKTMRIVETMEERIERRRQATEETASDERETEQEPQTRQEELVEKLEPVLKEKQDDQEAAMTVEESFETLEKPGLEAPAVDVDEVKVIKKPTEKSETEEKREPMMETVSDVIPEQQPISMREAFEEKVEPMWKFSPTWKMPQEKPKEEAEMRPTQETREKMETSTEVIATVEERRKEAEKPKVVEKDTVAEASIDIPAEQPSALLEEKKPKTVFEKFKAKLMPKPKAKEEPTAAVGQSVPVQEPITEQGKPTSQKEPMTVKETLEEQLEPIAKLLKDPRTGKEYPVEEPVKLRTAKGRKPKGMTLKEALDKDLLKPQPGKILNPNTGKPLTIQEAVNQGILDGKCAQVVDPYTGSEISLEEALAKGVVDPNTGKVKDPKSKKPMGMDKALEEGIVKSAVEAPGLPRRPKSKTDSKRLSFHEALDSNLIDQTTGLVLDPVTDEQVTIPEAISRGIIDGETTEIIDPATGSAITMAEALRTGVMDPVTGNVTHPEFNVPVPLEKAIRDGLIIDVSEAAKQKGMTLKEALDSNFLDPKSGLVRDPKTGDIISISEAVERGILDSATAQIVDPKTGKMISLRDALAKGIVDSESGSVKHPKSRNPVPIGKALKEGLIKDTSLQPKQMTLKEALEQRLLDPKSGWVRDPSTNEIYSIPEAIEQGVLDGKTPQIVDPATGQEIGLQAAIDKGIVDPDTGSIREPSSPKSPVIVKRVPKAEQVVQPEPSKPGVTLTEALDTQIFDPETGIVTDPSTGDKCSLQQAVERGIIDGARPQVINPDTGQKLGLSDALKSGLVDPISGIAVDPNAMTSPQLPSQEIPVEESPYKPLTLLVALEKGLFDPKVGLFSDPKTGKKFNVSDAIDKGLLDGDRPQIKDPKTGKIITLKEALAKGFTGKMRDPGASAKIPSIEDLTKVEEIIEKPKEISMVESSDAGPLETIALTIERSYHVETKRPGEEMKDDDAETKKQGVVDAEVSDLTKELSISRVDQEPSRGPESKVMKEYPLSMEEKFSTLPKDLPETKAGVTVTESLDRKLLEPVMGKIVHSEQLGLDSAAAEKLHQAKEEEGVSEMAVVTSTSDKPETDKVVPGQGQADTTMVVSVSKDEGLSERYRPGGTMTLTEAIERGHCDAGARVFTDPVSGKTYDLPEAITLGLIDTTKRPEMGLRKELETGSAASETETAPEETATPSGVVVAGTVQAGVSAAAGDKHKGMRVEETVPMTATRDIGVNFTTPAPPAIPVPSDQHKAPDERRVSVTAHNLLPPASCT